MTSESSQKRLDRLRVPGVRMHYDLDVSGVVEKRELPFIVGILADLSGDLQEPPPPLRSRSFIEIDRDNFDVVLGILKTRLAMRVPNTLHDRSPELELELSFRALEDFQPAAVARQIEPLRELLEARLELVELRNSRNAGPEFTRRLDQICALLPPLADDEEQWRQAHAKRGEHTTGDTGAIPIDPRDLEVQLQEVIARIDRLLSAQLDLILHHPRFQTLEASWRGLHFLVHEAETCGSLKIRVMDITKKELLADQDHAPEFDQSVLFRKVYEEALGMIGGEPFGVLIGDYEFDHSQSDVSLLERLSSIAAAAHAPFIAAASSRFFGCVRFSELAELRDLAQTVVTAQHARWHSFRERLDARYVGLCLPRILLRLPYGRDTQPVADFDYQENTSHDHPDRYLWGNPAYAFAACLTQAFSRSGFCRQIGGVEGGGLVRGLPVHQTSTAEGDLITGPTEIAITERHELELSRLGFIPLMPLKGTTHAVFFSAPSCHKSEEPDRSSSEFVAAPLQAADLSTILFTSRFAHYVYAVMRDGPVGVKIPSECEAILNQWITNYVTSDPEESAARSPRWPLSEARIEVIVSPVKPRFTAVCYLRPQFLHPAWLRVEVVLPHQKWFSTSDPDDD